MTCQNLACDPPGWNIYNFIWHVFPENCHNTNYTVMGVVDVDIYCLLLMVVRFHALYLVYIPFQYEPHSVYNATIQWWNHLWSSRLELIWGFWILFRVIILIFRTISQQLISTNSVFLKCYKIVLEIRKLVLFFKLSGLDFRKLFLNTFYN